MVKENVMRLVIENANVKTRLWLVYGDEVEGEQVIVNCPGDSYCGLDKGPGVDYYRHSEAIMIVHCHLRVFVGQ